MEAEKKRRLEAKNKVTSLVDGKRALKGGILLAGFKGPPMLAQPLLLNPKAPPTRTRLWSSGRRLCGGG